MSPYTLDTTYWRAENTRLYKFSTTSSVGSEIVLSGLNINVTSYTKIIFEGFLKRRSATSPNSPNISIDVKTDIGGLYTTLSDSSVAQIVIDITQAKKITLINSFMSTSSYITRIRLA